jgi:preprotein translocase subunit YajC
MHPLLNAFMSQTSQGTGGGASSLLGNPLIMLPLILAIFYFMLIRPQGKQQKEHRSFLQNLKKGDDVVTSGGIIGRVVQVEDRAVTLDVGSGNKMRILKAQIATAWVEKPVAAEPAKAEAKK